MTNKEKDMKTALLIILCLLSIKSEAAEVGDSLTVKKADIACRDYKVKTHCRYCDDPSDGPVVDAIEVVLSHNIGPINTFEGSALYKTCSQFADSFPSGDTTTFRIQKKLEEIWGTPETVHTVMEFWLNNLSMKGEGERDL